MAVHLHETANKIHAFAPVCDVLAVLASAS